jgi:tRNA(Ile)-lysidine synthase
MWSAGVCSRVPLSLEKRVLLALRSAGSARPGDRLGVAVSGGGDSVALLLLLQGLCSESGISLVVIHFNHLLRGSDSDADEVFVSNLARTSQLEFLAAREDVAALARQNRWNLEDAARRARYAYFERIVTQGNAAQIAVGHTLDDQAETVMARLLRGTGLRGLTAIHSVRGPIIRPLLDVRRRELRDYLKRRGVQWREDATNSDPGRLRARLRADLLPEIEKNYAPAIAIHLAELARQAQAEEVFWSALVEAGFRRHVKVSVQGLEINGSDLLAPLTGLDALDGSPVQQALSRRLIRRIVEESCGRGNFPAARHVEEVMGLAEADHSGQVLQLPHGLRVLREFGRLTFVSPDEPGQHKIRSLLRSVSYEHRFEAPAGGSVHISIPEIRSHYRLKLIDWPSVERETREGAQALDPASLRSPLVLRNWRAGDAYCPAGRRRSRKIARMLLLRRIPRNERAGWPVLTSGGDVIWAKGFPPAKHVTPGQDTQKALVILEQKV